MGTASIVMSFRSVATCVVALLLCASFAVAADLAIVGATVHPAPDAAPIADATVLVRDGKLHTVAAARDVRVPADATVIDARGMHVVAGFWNSHVHLLRPDVMNAGTRDPAALQAALRALLMRWGFTAAFDIASLPGNALALRQRIERGELRGPLLLTVDAPFYPARGTPIYVRKLYEDNRWPSAEVATAAQARERAVAQLAAGADAVKLFTGAIVGGPVEVLPMDRDIARAVVGEARKRGKPAFAHPTDLRGIDIAVDAGVTILAHPTPTEGPWSPELVRRLKASDVALTPTLALFETEFAKMEMPAPVRERFGRDAAQQVKALADAGGTILFGTDVGYLPNTDTTRDLELMLEAGLDWKAVLASLTTAPARRFGYGDRKGRIVTGMDADVVILGSDPASGGKAFADVRYTIRGGEIVYPAQ